MIQVTRLYKNKKEAKVKSHAVYIAPAAVAMVRGSTVLKGQKATITLVSGEQVPVAEAKNDVLTALGVRSPRAASARRR